MHNPDYYKLYYAKNKSAILAKNKLWREANPEKYKAWFLLNSWSIRKKRKAWRLANKKTIKAKAHTYYLNNKDKIEANRKQAIVKRSQTP